MQYRFVMKISRADILDIESLEKALNHALKFVIHNNYAIYQN